MKNLKKKICFRGLTGSLVDVTKLKDGRIFIATYKTASLVLTAKVVFHLNRISDLSLEICGYQR